MDDGGGIGGVIGDIAGAVGEELANFGKSAVSQVKGSATDQPQTPPKVSDTGDTSTLGEIKKFGQSVASQVTGSDAANLGAMQQKDEELSRQEAAQVAAKIKRVYEEYAAKKKREEMARQQQEQQKEVQKKEAAEISKKQEDKSVNPAVARTRAEIKNYGAE